MNIVCNIPHSGLIIPDWSLCDYIIPLRLLNEFRDRIVDKNVDMLFDFVPSENKVISYLSRIVVDMERYRWDSEEPMSKYGMGFYYKKDDMGNIIRPTRYSFNKCLAYYESYWRELEDKVENVLKSNNYCLLLDCHSFHDGIKHTGYSVEEFPDICIGFNGETAPKEAAFIRQFFIDKGYSVLYNVPFEGSVLPKKYINDNRVESVMIEFHRRVYDNSNFETIRGYCKELIGLLTYFYLLK